MNWHDTPPTTAGRYYVRQWNGQEMTAVVYEKDGQLIFESDVGSRYLCEKGLEDYYQFGPRIPTNDELAELPGLIGNYGRQQMFFGMHGDKQLQRNANELITKIEAIMGVADETDGQ